MTAIASQYEVDFPLFSEAAYTPEYYTVNNMQTFMDAPSYNYPRPQEFPPMAGFAAGPMHSDVHQSFHGKHSPHLYPIGSPELRPPPSNLSTASGPSASSSTIGSPYSNHGHPVPVQEWSTNPLGINPEIVGFDTFPQDFSFGHSGMEPEYSYTPLKPGFVGECATIHESTSHERFPPSSSVSTFVPSQELDEMVLDHKRIADPSMIHPFNTPTPAHNESSDYHPQSMYPPPQSPTPSHHSTQSSQHIKRSQSPFLGNYSTYPYPDRRPSLVSNQSFGSPDGSFDSDDTLQKGRCPNLDCGKVFKDLKAHMLTHQNERPMKCPLVTCDYHVKGFARKYDKNRHTLTHYKGTMVCGFCPGSGSAAEKSFNRADVFKRHLTSVHAVEQTPPNSRKKTSGNVNAGNKLAGYAPDATGKCSTCSAMFQNAQDFYEHLDDCVLRIVQQEDPSEAINAQRLAEVENDAAVHDTLRSNGLPITTINYTGEEDDDEEADDDNDGDYGARASRRGAKRVSPTGAVQKRGGLTHSKGGVTLHTKGGRKKRKDLPTSWGMSLSQMKMKKRVICAFDGQRRLWKDDMMLSTDYEVRLPLGDGKHYVTDLDVQTLKRAEAFHNATDEEKGPDYGNDLAGLDLEKLMEVKAEAS